MDVVPKAREARRRGKDAKIACVQCRMRKVRCDSRGNTVCSSCQRLSFACSFGAQPGVTYQGHVEKLRTSHACSQCRMQKVKCSGETPICANCIRRRQECSFGNEFQQLDSIEAPERLAQSTASGHHFHLSANDPSKQELASLVDKYFEHVYPLPMYAFHHPPTVKERCVENTLDQVLGLSICCITAVKLNMQQFYPSRTEAWLERAETTLWRDIESPTITKIQSMLLVMLYRIESERPAKAFMLAAIAARMASALHLNYERKELGAAECEVRRRIMWTIAVLDGSFALGLPEYEVASFENIYVQLPCREASFRGGEDVRTEHLRHSTSRHLQNLGCIAFVIRLGSMRRDIMRLSRQLNLSDQPAPYLEDLVQRFDGILDQIQRDLYTFHPNGPQALQWAISNGRLPRFLAAHLSVHQAYCDLYRLFLPGYSEAAPPTVLASVSSELQLLARERCKHHVLAVLGMITQVQDMCAKWILLDNDNAICVYHTARVLAFLSQIPNTGSSASTGNGLSDAKICLNFLHHFFEKSAYARPLIDDLEAMVQQETTIERTTLPAALNHWHGTDTWLPHEGYKHQRLAIHSLLRRTHFGDDNSDGLSISSPASTSHSTHILRR